MGHSGVVGRLSGRGVVLLPAELPVSSLSSSSASSVLSLSKSSTARLGLFTSVTFLETIRAGAPSLPAVEPMLVRTLRIRL